ncbi:hypothetical protein COCSUDRAFT_33125 [Coccomyxa subellipsoidea C-169]|uniref:Uncharacterized protein n=1 Tax=Coccomyxa subellipsoidea (strain C-169) TaxID=574566 RepID=I0YYW0_COCSC|nr:hypothetical protein COCSUDRAFT_33125 [Coccomyxa subellipsoidea C-169]EIE23579.1 hypothetical protein COCSUDRAFT_33125 [Coccomyxa subellipsoidea C-169]|eukprot:XP_005648123.1 hypothetical protein COCSUDRAFT_33125 [Coccomyxa subellipsoidea C-169]
MRDLLQHFEELPGKGVSIGVQIAVSSFLFRCPSKCMLGGGGKLLVVIVTQQSLLRG